MWDVYKENKVDNMLLDAFGISLPGSVFDGSLGVAVFVWQA